MPSTRTIPAPTVGGAISSGETVMHAGAFDQSAVALLSGVLVFAPPPLDQELEVTGPVSVRLWIASDAPDTDFTAKLIDVYPPSPDFSHGFAMNLTEGLLRVRYRDSWERPELMVPGEVYAITIELFPVAAVTDCGSTYRAATSRISTSTRIRASRKASGCRSASPATVSSSRRAALRTSCCPSSRGTQHWYGARTKPTLVADRKFELLALRRGQAPTTSELIFDRIAALHQEDRVTFAPGRAARRRSAQIMRTWLYARD
jgi:X-Pro dipeptidyl-peptidase C-terminal non-catalytic domain